jgi:cholesterol transport system auxiliary component
VLLMVLGGCTLPHPASTPLVYDFGPGAVQIPPTTRIANLPPLELSTVQAVAALNSSAVLYRLTYADAQQLKPYTLARWSMPPAQLIGQRLRERLGMRRAIVAPGEIVHGNPARLPASAQTPAVRPEPLLNLRLELEEFSQLFEAPDQSTGLLRLRATLLQRGPGGESLLAQRSFIVQQPAPTPDASGGVRALTAATDGAIADMETWLGQVMPQGSAP